MSAIIIRQTKAVTIILKVTQEGSFFDSYYKGIHTNTIVLRCNGSPAVTYRNVPAGCDKLGSFRGERLGLVHIAGYILDKRLRSAFNFIDRSGGKNG